jgi:hypothetical protein
LNLVFGIYYEGFSCPFLGLFELRTGGTGRKKAENGQEKTHNKTEGSYSNSFSSFRYL